jgi:hypothetical protein
MRSTLPLLLFCCQENVAEFSASKVASVAARAMGLVAIEPLMLVPIEGP